ncbi:MAG: 2,3-bisphosphoglycerate-independent phosphoglycerate mutase [Bacteroidia bacterium]
MLSNGGVHSSDEHLKNLCSIFKKHGLDEQVFIHAFLDGRDCDPNSGLGFVNDLMKDERIGKTKLASVIGRYFAMDRDKRWERVKKAYDLLVKGIGHKTKDVAKAIKNSYQNNITDEFMEPISVVEDDGKPVATIQENDIVICFNFRTDRGREITTVLTQKAFPDFGMHPLNLNYFTFTEYDKTYKNVKVFFENSDLKMTMGEHLEKLGMRQVRAAETEKYPHVTFFFSGGRETEFEGEERIMAASPKVATYDLHPEMSAFELKDRVKSRIEKEDIDFYCVNFANPDMVGHTGVFSAIKKACETVDQCVGELIDAAAKHGYKVMIIADHGNADYAVNADGSPNTAHSLNPVPIIILGDESAKEKLQNGILADVSPTLLKMMGLPQPHEMTGKPLF